MVHALVIECQGMVKLQTFWNKDLTNYKAERRTALSWVPMRVGHTLRAGQNKRQKAAGPCVGSFVDGSYILDRHNMF